MAAKKAAKLEIVKAEYGADERWADVTDIVAGLVADGRLVVGVGNGPLGQDPAPNAAKLLILTYKVGRKSFTDEYDEGTVVELP